MMGKIDTPIMYNSCLGKHSSHEFETVTMAGRFWKWRLQGGAVTLARKAKQLYDNGEKPDVIFASSSMNSMTSHGLQ